MRNGNIWRARIFTNMTVCLYKFDYWQTNRIILVRFVSIRARVYAIFSPAPSHRAIIKTWWLACWMPRDIHSRLEILHGTRFIFTGCCWLMCLCARSVWHTDGIIFACVCVLWYRWSFASKYYVLQARMRVCWCIYLWSIEAALSWDERLSLSIWRVS